ncbi:MAG: hypothetical protein VXW43_19950, partial [Pseudomonadota bacterium]|nr:hypothetical protein [Pseudomonadota bacterium]
EDEDEVEQKKLIRKSRADTTLGGTLREWMDDCQCVRVTLWMIDNVAVPPRMFNVAGTQLGNAMISIKVGVGLAACACTGLLCLAAAWLVLRRRGGRLREGGGGKESGKGSDKGDGGSEGGGSDGGGGDAGGGGERGGVDGGGDGGTGGGGEWYSQPQSKVANGS